MVMIFSQNICEILVYNEMSRSFYCEMKAAFSNSGPHFQHSLSMFCVFLSVLSHFCTDLFYRTVVPILVMCHLLEHRLLVLRCL